MTNAYTNPPAGAVGYIDVAAGSTVTTIINNGAANLVITAIGAITTWNIHLPTTPFDGQIITIAWPGGDIGDLNLSAPGGATIGDGAPTSGTGGTGGSTSLQYQINSDSWLVVEAPSIGDSGGSLTITDGTHTVADATTLTITGATVGGTTPNATLAISGGGGGVSTAQVSVSSVQLLALAVTPVQIVVAPGAGKIIRAINIMYDYTFVTTPYTQDGGIALYYGTSTGGTPASDTAVINAIASSQITLYNGFVGAPVDPVTIDNTAIYLICAGDPATLGDGTLKVTVQYTVVTR